jgi:hypothetical protein
MRDAINDGVEIYSTLLNPCDNALHPGFEIPYQLQKLCVGILSVIDDGEKRMP